MVSQMNPVIFFFNLPRSFMEEQTVNQLKLSQKTAEDAKLPDSLYEATVTLILKPDKDST